jgi:3-isopropylmalate dehydrogenase
MAHGREILLGMRQGLDLYANFRPCKCLHESLSPLRGKGPAEIDMLVFRENTEDLYVSLGGTFKEGTADEVAQDISLNTRKGVERILRHGFDVARARPKADGTKKLTMTDKHNAVRFGGGLWKRTMEMVRKPERFHVVVANNLFGDILTDLGAALMGGLGLAASGNVHPGKIGLFEPVHGSAPDIAGKGIANPLAAFWTASLMLDFLATRDPGNAARFLRAVKAVDAAVAACVAEGPRTPDLGGQAKTGEVGAWVRAHVARALAV